MDDQTIKNTLEQLKEYHDASMKMQIIAKDLIASSNAATCSDIKSMYLYYSSEFTLKANACTNRINDIISDSLRSLE